MQTSNFSIQFQLQTPHIMRCLKWALLECMQVQNDAHMCGMSVCMFIVESKVMWFSAHFSQVSAQSKFSSHGFQWNTSLCCAFFIFIKVLILSGCGNTSPPSFDTPSKHSGKCCWPSVSTITCTTCELLASCAPVASIADRTVIELVDLAFFFPFDGHCNQTHEEPKP